MLRCGRVHVCDLSYVCISVLIHSLLWCRIMICCMIFFWMPLSLWSLVIFLIFDCFCSVQGGATKNYELVFIIGRKMSRLRCRILSKRNGLRVLFYSKSEHSKPFSKNIFCLYLLFYFSNGIVIFFIKFFFHTHFMAEDCNQSNIRQMY